MEFMDGAIERLRLLLEEQKEIIANLRKENTRLKNEVAALSKQTQGSKKRSGNSERAKKARSPPPARALPSKPMPTRTLPQMPNKGQSVKTANTSNSYVYYLTCFVLN